MTHERGAKMSMSVILLTIVDRWGRTGAPMEIRVVISGESSHA